MKRTFFLFFFLPFTFCILHSQNFTWKVDMLGFVDNREYKSDVQKPQSMLGVRLAPLAGLEWSEHSVFIGVNALKEFGSANNVYQVLATAYYRYEGENFDFRLGAFPRSETLGDFPAAFFQDSLTYYRPNINGLFWQYKKYDNLRLGVFLDWTSRQTKTQREAFLMGGSGLFRYNVFFLKFNFYMYHRAEKAIEDNSDHIHDMGLGYYAVGLDVSKHVPLDTAYVQAGLLQGMERRRAVTGWQTPQGLLMEAGVAYKRIGLKNTLYTGEPLMVFYDTYNAERDLYWGDPFYRRKFYNRTDLYADFINTDHIKCRFDVSLHHSSGNWSTQQQLILNVSLGK